MEPVRRGNLGRWVAIDGIGLLTAGVAVEAVSAGGAVGRGPGWAGAVVGLLALALAISRRLLPTGALALATILVAVLTGWDAPGAPVVGAAALMYAVAIRLPRSSALAVLVAGVIGSLIGTTGFLRFSVSGPARWGVGAVAVPALVLVASWAAGYAVDRQRRYTVAMHERNRSAEREQVAAERQALAEERLQIAREIHDVVSHTLAVITVQAGVAGHLAGEQPDEARRALGSIEETSRSALTEMRSLLTVLRPDRPAREAPAPPPGLADLPALAARSKAAGIHVELLVEGEPHGLAPGPDLAAYRVVQEALTNVLRHAATDRCSVNVAYRPSGIIIEVSDPGRGPRLQGSGGHGLIGMRERLAMYGGRMTAGAREGGGFRVTAELPVAGVAR